MNYTEIEMEWMKEILRDKEEENKTLKDKIEFLTSCLDDRDKSIELMKEEIKKLKAELEIYKKQYEHTTWDYIEEDLYDLDC